MSNQIRPQTVKGFRDFLPEDLAVRNKVIGIFKEIFEKYGFQEIQTPVLEYQNILLGKYGQEAEKLMYLFEDLGKRAVGLRYDLTVPTARVIAQYPNIVKPFKRYQIQQVYRADKPQRGRYREITQCDIDTFGSSSPLSDAEIIAIISDCLTTLGFNNFTIRINSRQVLFTALKKAGLAQNKYMPVLQSLDKLDKKDYNEVIKEVKQKGVSEREFQKLNDTLRKTSPDQNLDNVIELANKLGAKNILFFKGLVRGLDYYTGTIFETVVSEPDIGSIAGGGRYDNLIGQFINHQIPAVGTTLGLDRICDVITELNLWPNLQKSLTKVLVTLFSADLLNNSIDTINKLRKEGISAEIYLDKNTKLDKQLKYADKKRIPYVIIIGPEEVKKKVVKLKNMKTGEQKEISQSEISKFLISNF